MNLLNKTNEQLHTLRELIENNPDNREHGKLWLYKTKARRKLDQIAWAITHNLAEARAKAGNPVACDGYSGRQQKRR